MHFALCFIISEKDKVYNRMTKNKAIDKTVACSLKIERGKRREESTFVEREMKKIKIFVYNMSVYWLYRSEKERKKTGEVLRRLTPLNLDHLPAVHTVKHI